MHFSIAAIVLGAASLTSALPITVSKALSHREAAPAVEQAYVEERITIYVNEQGIPVSTTTVAVPGNGPTPSPSPAPASASTSSQQNINVDINAKKATPTTSDPPAASASADPAPSTGGRSGVLGQGVLSGSPFKKGVTYSANANGGGCKSADLIKDEVATLKGKGHDLIRIYGTECNGVANLKAAVAGTEIWMFLGIFDVNAAASGAAEIAKQLGNDWSGVHTISIGNEIINNDLASLDAGLSGLSTGRSALRGLGYTGPVVSVDTAFAIENKGAGPLCANSDYCVVNIHTFWDDADASISGTSIQGHIKTIQEKAGVSKVVVGEAGWPTCGNGAGGAVASKAAQSAALASIKESIPEGVIYFSAFDEKWKTDNSDLVEKCWGMY